MTTPPLAVILDYGGQVLPLDPAMGVESPVDSILVNRHAGRSVISPMLEYELVLLVANIAIMITSLVSNVCVIYFICSQAKARTAHNVTIVSIAVTDILVAVFVIPVYLAVATYQAATRGDELTPFLCKLQTYTWYWCKTVTVYSIVAMVCDRYGRVTKPRKAHLLSGRYMFFLSFLWFFGAAYNVWQLVIKSSAYITVRADHTGQNVTVRACYSLGPYRFLESGFIFVDFVMIFLLPATVILSMYGHMLYIGCCSQKGNIDSRMRFPSRRRLVMSISLFALFLLCQLPYEIRDTQQYFSQHVSFRSITTAKVLDTLSFSQGVLNVIAYASCSSELHAIIRKWCLRRKSNRRTRVTSSSLCATAHVCALAAPHMLVRSNSANNLDELSRDVMVMRSLLAKRASIT